VLVHGTGRDHRLASPRTTGPAGVTGLLLLAPSRAERADRAWVEEAAGLAGDVAEDGLVVVPRPSHRLRAELAAVGLEPVTRLRHVPDVARGRYTFPVRGPAAMFALQRVVPLHPLKRALARALVLPGAATVGQTTVVFRRPGARPLLEWLCGLGPPLTSCSPIVVRSWRPAGATVVYRFGDNATPDAVAKLGGGAAEEARALRALADSARGASANVPSILGEGTLGGLPLIVESPVAGSPAPGALRSSPGVARNLLRALASWLEAWNAATIVRRTFGSADAERLVLDPARRLASVLADGGAYLSRLDRLCGACVGSEIPFVAAHNDLTAANVLLGERGTLGIVDWEEAATSCLPLGDLAYAAADVAAATDGYRDRPAGFAACFEPDGTFADLTGELLGNAARSQGLDAPAVDLCLQACWLRHADNELREAAARGLLERPFLGILRRAAAMRFGP
jgi:hypothetical protein